MAKGFRASGRSTLSSHGGHAKSRKSYEKHLKHEAYPHDIIAIWGRHSSF